MEDLQESLHENMDRRVLVFQLYHKWKEPMTDREAMILLGFTDMNKVRPRITELVQDGKLKEVGTIRCPETNRSVRLCEVA